MGDELALSRAKSLRLSIDCEQVLIEQSLPGYRMAWLSF
jgi:hypothetical protein